MTNTEAVKSSLVLVDDHHVVRSGLRSLHGRWAYRRRIDALSRGVPRTDLGEEEHLWRSLLQELPHRDYTTGFLLTDTTVHSPSGPAGASPYRIMGIIGSRVGETAERKYVLHAKNAIYHDTHLSILLPSGTLDEIRSFSLFDPDRTPISRAINGREARIVLPAAEDGGDELVGAILFDRRNDRRHGR